jgi:zinc transporter, ZIP family
MSLLRKAPAPTWVLGLVALLLLGATLAALAALAVLGGRSVPESTDPAAEEQELAVESTVLTPGAIELTVQNTSSDPVQIAQVFVNDVYVDLVGGTEPIGRLDTATLRLDYPWQDGQPYLVSMLTSTGSVIEQEISGTADTPDAGPAYIGWMAVLGACVGIVAVLLGMLFLPALRHAWPPSIRMLLAVTVGLLAFLAFDGTAKGLELAEQTGVAFGGAALVVLGAAVAYLLLAGADRGLLRRRRADAEEPGTGFRLALTIAAGIGLYRPLWGPPWSSASRCTTPPRASRSSPRSPTTGSPTTGSRCPGSSDSRSSPAHRPSPAPSWVPRSTTPRCRRSCSASASAPSSR